MVILSVHDWFGAPRLPKAFRRAGFHVTTLGFAGLLTTSSREVDSALFLPAEGSDEELLSAIERALRMVRPDIVVPTDDAAVELLHAVAVLARRSSTPDEALLRMLRDSTGDFARHATLRSRKELAAVADRLGVRAPVQAVVRSAREALEFAERHGSRVVFKAEESCAGFGVFICKDASEVQAALARFSGEQASALAHGLLAQTFVPGKTAMRAVIAWRGKVLAGLSAIKLETHPKSTGPSSVVEFIDHDEMAASASAMVEALGFSGFASLDFMLDEGGGAHLIELNPRPTPICHLGYLFDVDLCASLSNALAGQAVPTRSPQGVPRKVVLFPQEWVRDTASPHFSDAFHDVPWDEPDLVQAYLSVARQQMRWSNWRSQEARRGRVRTLLDESDA